METGQKSNTAVESFATRLDSQVELKPGASSADQYAKKKAPLPAAEPTSDEEVVARQSQGERSWKG
jgi:hypothetical protein